MLPHLVSNDFKPKVFMSKQVYSQICTTWIQLYDNIDKQVPLKVRTTLLDGRNQIQTQTWDQVLLPIVQIIRQGRLPKL